MKNRFARRRSLRPVTAAHFPASGRGFSPRTACQGVALIIVLAFIVILTGLIVAFFSRSITSRQMANASSNRVRTKIFAQGAVDTILSDLKQEIVLGSNATTVTTGATQTTIYVPKTPAYVMPTTSGKTNAANSLNPNLLKQSADKPGPVAPLANLPIRGSSLPTTTASLNSRTISAERWNKPLLMEKKTVANPSDLTPIDTGSNAFVPPNWVLVARDGSNPGAGGAKLTFGSGANTANSADLSNPGFVVGRYAYNIYHEGGLLDMNAAGYPAKDSTGTDVVSGTDASYKSALAFADLKQIPGLGAPVTGLTKLIASRADALISAITTWRNFGSIFPNDLNAPSGIWYTFTYPTTAGANFVNFVRNNPTGFLKVANAYTDPKNGEGDKFFTGRQELITMLMGGFSSDSNERANLQSALPYLSTFSRDLNQPSFAPDSKRPATQSGAGGNDFGTGSLTGGGTTYDDAINPPFLTVRAGTFKRFDSATATGLGADTVPGTEPLVKKRFALNRLAWLSSKGPSANNMTDPSVQATITALGGNPTSITDPIYIFVKQGTAQNIYNYFGLSWISDPVHSGASEWVYSHTGTAPVSSVPNLAASISKLGTLTKREPDFFELLRAAVTMGSLGKAYTAETGTSINGYQQTRIYSTARDQSVDAAIFQMGANIIDQFDYDGFPTRILANTGLQNVAFKEYRGVEDLPYINRIREARFRTEQSSPGYYSLPTTNQPLADPGKCVVLQQPEIWNPHAWSGSDINAKSRPTSFRIIALTCNPSHASDVITPVDNNLTSKIKLNVYWRPAGASNPRMSPPLNAQPAQPLTQDNSEMLFEMPANGNFLYREPTILMKPGMPGGSGLSNLRVGSASFVRTLSGANFFKCFDPADTYFRLPSGVTDNGEYIGIVPGGELFPLAWSGTIPKDYIAAGNPATDAPGIMHAQYAGVTSGDSITYRLQYNDSGRWLTYDEKYVVLMVTGNYDSWDRASSNQRYPFRIPIGGYDATAEMFDPRTVRFGTGILGRDARGNAYVPYGVSDLPVEGAQGMTPTFRSTETTKGSWWNSAYGALGSALGWYPPGIPNPPPMAPGMLAQNNPSALDSNNPYYYADPDGVVRRAMGAYARPTGGQPATTAPAGTASGIPTKKAYLTVGGTTTGTPYSITNTGEEASRPIVLNRPFRSVAELGYTFSGVPWKNLDFFTPESGSAALLDVFCLNEAGDSTGMVAGKVNLNTRQAPVLQAILAGAYKSEFAPATSLAATGNASANAIATGLVTRTSDTSLSLGTGSGPLKNLSELVGKWVGGGASIPRANAPFDKDGGLNYSGFAGLAATTAPPTQNPPNLSYILAQDGSNSGYTTMVAQRFREASLRALASTGQTRVWNLMIDVVAQTGRYPQSANALDKFLVEGEQRYWVHVAIDRCTGQVIDQQVEVVKE